MRIKIIDKEKCENCTQYTCSLNDIRTKSDFMSLKTEQYTCPVNIFLYGPTDEQRISGYIDFNLEKNECLYCCLCAIQCSQDNLLIEEFEYDARADFLRSKENGESQAQSALNTIALSYLNHIFDFAANTNMIRTLTFDGALITKSGEACMVEVDINNDSLECCRRLLADIMLYNHKNERKIKSGLMVINDFPKQGSRDVLTLIERIKEFESTSDFNIYITTFSLLRYYVIHIDDSDYELDDLLFNASINSKEDYLQKLIESNLITEEISSEIFGE